MKIAIRACLLAFVMIVFFSCQEEKAEPAPVASFTFVIGREGQVTFTNTSTSATSFIWTFGDGTTSTEESPEHSFGENETFNVALAVTGNGGTSDVSHPVTLYDVGLTTSEWLQEGRDYTICDDPGQNSGFTPCTNCSTWNFSLNSIAITTTGFPNVNLPYTISENNIDLGATTYTSTFEIVGNNLFITLHHNDDSSFPGCEDKMRFLRM